VAFEDTLEHEHVSLHEGSAIHGFLRQVCDGLHRKLPMRIQVGSFEAASLMVEAQVGVAIMPRSAASRHAKTMAIELVPLSDDWAIRQMKICVRSLDALPAFARDLVDLMAADAERAAPPDVD
jgi:DNA-binding transcriptional LysR family regulator